MVTVLQLIS